MPILTIFTPAYNRGHTLPRTYASLIMQTCKDFIWLIIDDGSVDNTREWVESLGEKVQSKGIRYDWMGVGEQVCDENHFVIAGQSFQIEYVYKQNGGLYTGYNTAYSTISTELCVCVDSDDFMPSRAVETIIDRWSVIIEKSKYCGLVGLDFNFVDKQPIGGYFPNNMRECNLLEIESKRIHVGDTKEVLRTDLMKGVSPMYGYKNEKDFNPWYMMMQVLDNYPIIVINENLCWVEYQIGKDSMSQNIWRQYYNSPRSFAKFRLMCMGMSHTTGWNRLRHCVHYISSCILSHDSEWFNNSPSKLRSILCFPLGFILSLIVRYKNR